MQSDTEFERPRHPIQVVASRTGLTMDVLRAWERRYQAVVPSRTETGRRRYSDADIERLIMLKRAMAGGRSIGQIASLDRDALVSLLEEDEAVARSAQPPVDSGTLDDAGTIVAECMRAIERLDGPGLRAVIAKATLELPQTAIIERVLAPLMIAVGEAWRTGSLRIAHEHLATATVQWFLGEITRRPAPHNAPTAVMATPTGQRHQVGVMLAAATAVSLGWNVVYLGADLPAEEISATTSQAGARLIGLSTVYPPDDPGLSSELGMLRRSVSPDVEIVLGGRASDSYRTIAEQTGCRIVDGLAEFRDYLNELSQRESAS